MRGDHQQGGNLFSYVSLEERVPRNHPLRKMFRLIDETLTNLDELFDELYATGGRPSIRVIYIAPGYTEFPQKITKRPFYREQ